MSAEPALLAQCAARAEALSRTLRKDQAELGQAAGGAEDFAEGAELVSAMAACLERIAAKAQATPPGISEPSQPNR
jgi:hypothetical protein